MDTKKNDLRYERIMESDGIVSVLTHYLVLVQSSAEPTIDIEF